MNPVELSEAWERVRTYWPGQGGEIPDNDMVAVAELFADVSKADTEAAIVKIARRGGKFPPNPSQVVAEAIRVSLPSLAITTQTVVAVANSHLELDALWVLRGRSPFMATVLLDVGWNKAKLAGDLSEFEGRDAEKAIREAHERGETRLADVDAQINAWDVALTAMLARQGKTRESVGVRCPENPLGVQR